MELDYGVQLYSVRDFIETDMEYTFMRIAEAGYKTVEFCNFCKRTPEEINALLAANGLAIKSAHVGLDSLTEDKIEETIAYQKALGNVNIVIPSADMETKEKIAEVVSDINRVIPVLKDNGMKLHYHTHWFDYEENGDGVRPYGYLENETDVLFEIDTYWAFYSGLDPIAEMERLRDRVELIHVKDGTKAGKPRVVGEGDAPIIDVVTKADELGFYKIVESEGMIPDGLVDVRHCLKYLRKVANGEITK